MSYLLALMLSVIVCAMTVALSLVQRNTEHIKSGRAPNASFSLVPIVPLFQLLALGFAWVLERIVPRLAVDALLATFGLLVFAWLWSFNQSISAYAQARDAAPHLAPDELEDSSSSWTAYVAFCNASDKDLAVAIEPWGMVYALPSRSCCEVVSVHGGDIDVVVDEDCVNVFVNGRDATYQYRQDGLLLS